MIYFGTRGTFGAAEGAGEEARGGGDGSRVARKREVERDRARASPPLASVEHAAPRKRALLVG